MSWLCQDRLRSSEQSSEASAFCIRHAPLSVFCQPSRQSACSNLSAYCSCSAVVAKIFANGCWLARSIFKQKTLFVLIALQIEVWRCRQISNDGVSSAETAESVLTVAPARPPSPSLVAMATVEATRLIASRKARRRGSGLVVVIAIEEGYNNLCVNSRVNYAQPSCRAATPPEVTALESL